MDNGQLVPELRFPEFEGDWELNKIKDIAGEKLTNGVFNDPEKVGTGYYLINVKDMYSGLAIDKNSLSQLDLDKDSFDKNKVKFGDVFFTRSSLVKEGIAVSAVNLCHDDDITFDGHLIKLSPNLDNNNPIFIGYVLRTHFVRKQLVARGKTGTMTTIGQNDIKPVVIPMALLKEQQKIANFLTAIDQRITLLKQKKSALEDYKKGLMQKIFNQEVRFRPDSNAPLLRGDTGVCSDAPESNMKTKNHNNPNEHPPAPPSRGEELSSSYPDWKMAMLGNVAKLQMGTSPKSAAYNNERDGLPLIQGNADIKNRESSPRIYTSEITKECRPNDLLLSVRAPVGEIAKSMHHACIGRGVAAISAKAGMVIEYLYQYLLWYEPRWKSISQGSTFESVNSKDISSLKFKVPCKEEQQKIANFLSAIDQKINAMDKQIGDSELFKKGLLQRMFV